MRGKTSKESNIYKTSDLALVAAIFLSYPFEAIDKSNPRKAQFLFKRSPELSKLIREYWKGELKVTPQAYFGALRVIKGRIYAEE